MSHRKNHCRRANGHFSRRKISKPIPIKPRYHSAACSQPSRETASTAHGPTGPTSPRTRMTCRPTDGGKMTRQVGAPTTQTSRCGFRHTAAPCRTTEAAGGRTSPTMRNGSAHTTRAGDGSTHAEFARRKCSPGSASSLMLISSGSPIPPTRSTASPGASGADRLHDVTGD